MRCFFLSDVHGRHTSLAQALSAFRREGADLLVLLGDVLYHGPRNGLFEGYDPQKSVELLTPLADRIVGIKGNCDSEVDQALLPFPFLCEYSHLVLDQTRFFLVHGHKYWGADRPPLTRGTVVASGHTHLYTLEERDGLVFFNPGSCSLPKGGNPPTYGLWDGRGLSVRTLDGRTLMAWEPEGVLR